MKNKKLGMCPDCETESMLMGVKPESGEKIVEIKNLFTPILNLFTVAKEQKQYYLKVDKESRRQRVYLNKIEMVEKKKIMDNNIVEKIKTLLDQLEENKI